MRFKISLPSKAKHTDIVSGVGWMNPDEVYSCGDDHVLLQWNLLTNETTKVAELDGVLPVEMHWLPRIAGNRSKNSDVLVIGSADGKFHLVSKNGRIEKSVDGHKGAILVCRWNHDGNALLTTGEDGLIKIWSRSGMLRSTLAQSSMPVYGGAWSPDSDAIVYTIGTSMIIKPLAPNSKPIQWKAHDGMILKVAWNPNNGLILSGGEDTRYKVWDHYGRQLYSSATHHHPITSLAWAPDGELFAVGSFNTIRLCDKAGWCHSLEKPNTGSIFNLSWSSDGTQVAGACGNGHVLFAHIIERYLEWKHYEATVINKTTISLRNVTNEAREKLELRDRIIKLSLAHGHLVVVSSTQAYIYSTRNWNTPIIFDLKESSVSLILQAEKHFILVDGSSVQLYSYEGRLVSSPRWSGMRTDVLSHNTLSLSNDTVAVRDKTDEKMVYLFDTSTGKPLNDGRPWVHKIEISQIALDKAGLTHERKLAVVDKNHDLFLVPVSRIGAMVKSIKLGTMVGSLKWNDGTNQLAAMLDTALSVWFLPSVAFVDRDLLPITTWQKTNDYGKNASVDSFVDNFIVIRRSDGSLVTTTVSPYPGLLHGYASANKWEEAVRLARVVKEDLVWGCLAGFAIAAKDLDTAEIAYAAINQSDKVKYIQYIKDMPIKEARNAEMALLGGHIGDAENILIRSGLTFRAIMLNLNTYQWERALQLAAKHNTHIDTVVLTRQKYLHRFGKEESIELIKQYANKVDTTWQKIEEKIEKEYQSERERPRQ